MYSEKELIRIIEEDGIDCYNTSFDDQDIITIEWLQENRDENFNHDMENYECIIERFVPE